MRKIGRPYNHTDVKILRSYKKFKKGDVVLITRERGYMNIFGERHPMEAKYPFVGCIELIYSFIRHDASYPTAIINGFGFYLPDIVASGWITKLYSIRDEKE